MSRIRILYTIPNFDTAGSGIALMKMASSLDKTRFEPMIVCLHDRGKYFEEVRSSGIPVHIFPYVCALKPRLALIRNVISTAMFFRSLRPDIVFSYHYAPNISEVLAARLAGCKFMYVKKNMGWQGGSHNQWRIRTYLSHAITVQNTDMMRNFFPGNPMARLISIGVDQQEYFPRTADLVLKDELNIAPGKKVVLCVANLIPKKGIEYLVRGFAASAVRTTAKLVIVGNNDTPLRVGMDALIAELGIGEDVLFTGKRNDVPRFYSIADLFILPSTGDEGAPIAIQEAMASGVPVITTDTPGNRDQLKDLPGQLIPPSDAVAIRSKIDQYLSIDDLERTRIIDTQLKIVEERYSLKEEVRQHEALYREITKR